MPSLTTHYSFNLPAVNSVNDEDVWGGQLNANWVATDNLFYQLYQGVATLSGTYSLTGDITFSGETIFASETKVKDVALIIEDTASSEGNLLFDTNEDTAGEVLGKIDFQGHDAASNDALYASIKAKITDATDTSEGGSVVINTTQDGSPVDELIIEKGTYTQGATGGAKGSGTINAKDFFIDGVTIQKPIQTQQVFTSSGTWNKPARCKKVEVIVVGGGGAGAGSGSGFETSGGTTSFGSFCSATGGGHSFSNPTNGGIGVGGDINLRGDRGFSSVGGNNAFSVGRGISNTNAKNAQGFGCGGGGEGGNGGGGGGVAIKIIDVTSTSQVSVSIGAGGISSRSSENGGAGSSGIVVVKEYY